MPRRNKISEIEAKEIEEARKKNKNKNVDRRLKVLIMHAEGMKRKEISAATDYSENYISQLVVKYCQNGLSEIIENHYKGNHRNLSFDEEAELLKGFKDEAENGQIIETSKIKEAYEKKTGKNLDTNKGQIYRVLKRHKWAQSIRIKRVTRKLSPQKN